MRKGVTYNKYHPKFTELVAVIHALLKITLPNQWHKMNYKISDNSHVISPNKFRSLNLNPPN